MATHQHDSTISRSSRPRLRNDHLSGRRSRDAATCGAYLPFLQRYLPAEISGEPRPHSSARSRARARRLRMRTPNTPARCTRRSARRGQARARSAEWRWNPLHVTLEEQPNEELIDMTRRFWWSLALTTPLLGFMVAEFLPGHLLHRLPSGWLNWIELALATPVVLWGGWPFFQRGWASVDNAPPEYVHAHRPRRRRSFRL